MSSGYRNDDRDRGRRRPSPPRSSRRSGGDERNASSSSSRHENRGGVPPPPPPLASRRVNEGGRSTLAAPPKFSGNAFTETELLKDIPKKKFTGRCRLFLGNLPLDLKESELKELFTPHGEISELYLSGKGFAFLRLDTRAHAESAKEALDGKLVKNRQIRVRYAVHGSTIKLKELSPVVSNEMLHLTFSAFGEVERAVHIVDEKGKPTGEGIIEFEKKSAAQEALNQIRERVFLLTANSRPLQAELLEPKDEEDGFSEKMIMRTQQLIKERELGPRFATMNSFEYIYGRRWKELFEFENKRRQELEAELREQRRRLDADMEVAYEDYKAELLREELLRRQEELERLDAARLMRDQQRHHMMEGGMDRWADGPMSRPPPPFGMQRPPPMGGMPSPFGMGMGGPQQMGGGGGHLGMGRELMDGNGRGGDRDGGGDRMRPQNGHGPSPLDVNKLLQSLNKPNDGGGPGRGGGGGDERGMGLGGGLSGTPMMQHLMHGGMHGGMGNPLDRPQQNPLDLSGGPSPLAAFANMINPLNQMRRPDSGPGPGGSSLPPGSGNRIPPPPPPIGGMKPPPNQLMDFPPEKRSRH